MNPNSYSRRRFLQTSAIAATATFGAVPLIGAKTDKTYKTALIGSGWWGMNILREAIQSKRCQVVALADVDPNAMEVSAEEVNDLTGTQPKTYKDYREMLAAEKPEIVIIATPDHWHALQTIDCVNAGAHVFVEKPTGHTVKESRAMVTAAQGNERVVQVGLHRRIGPHHVSGMKFIKDGNVGKIGSVEMIVHYGGGFENPTRNGNPPQGMDWDMWCGPAPTRPFCRKLHPGGWRNFLDYANGLLGDWGVHWLDQVLWWTEEKYPKKVFSTGARHIAGDPVLNDKEQTTDAPDSQVAVYEFESFTATWDHRRFGSADNEKHNVGCYFYGTEGTFHMGWRDGWTFYPRKKGASVVHEDPQLQQPDGHNLTLLWNDFIEAIETGRKPVADIESSHRSSNLSMLGMLSYKLGRSIQWDGAKEIIPGDPEANKLLSREYRDPFLYPKV